MAKISKMLAINAFIHLRTIQKNKLRPLNLIFMTKVISVPDFTWNHPWECDSPKLPPTLASKSKYRLIFLAFLEFSINHHDLVVYGKLWPKYFENKLWCVLMQEYFFIFFTISLPLTIFILPGSLYNILVGMNTFLCLFFIENVGKNLKQ